MLQLAGIVLCGGLVHSDDHEDILKGVVAVIDPFGYGAAGLGESDEAGLIHKDVAVGFELADSTADRRLAEAHMLADIYGSYGGFLLREHQNGLKIHLTGFMHCFDDFFVVHVRSSKS